MRIALGSIPGNARKQLTKTKPAQWDGSADKGTCHGSLKSECDPWDSDDSREKLFYKVVF